MARPVGVSWERAWPDSGTNQGRAAGRAKRGDRSGRTLLPPGGSRVRIPLLTGPPVYAGLMPDDTAPATWGKGKGERAGAVLLVLLALGLLFVGADIISGGK